MPGIEYQHIGHDPSTDAVALWSVDDHGRLHEDRCEAHQPTVEWLGWSHQRLFANIVVKASGRVELGKRQGSIHISDPKLATSVSRLGRILSVLEERYPETRWFLFGGGYWGAPASEAFDSAAV